MQGAQQAKMSKQPPDDPIALQGPQLWSRIEQVCDSVTRLPVLHA